MAAARMAAKPGDSPFAVKARFSVSHSDDKSAVDLPHVVREAQAQPLEKLSHQVHGDYDKSNDQMTIVVPAPGVGSKDANLVVEELLMHAARTLNGEAADVVVADCASLNMCGATALALPQFKVDTGLVLFSLFLMLQQLDSKEACDRDDPASSPIQPRVLPKTRPS